MHRTLLSSSALGLALAATIAAGAARAGTDIVVNLATAPGGMVIVPPASNAPASSTTQLWVSDHLQGFCRVASTALTGCLTIGAPGQPAYKADTRQVFVPDLSSKSIGIRRLTFSASGTTTSGGRSINPTLTAADGGGKTGRLGDVRPDAVVVDKNGNLYVSANRNGNIYRITYTASNDTYAARARVIGQSSDGGRVLGLALDAEGNLYLAEATGVTVITGVGSCTPANPCVADPFEMPDVFAPQSLAYVAPHLYAGETTYVVVKDLETGEVATLTGDAGHPIINASGLAATKGTPATVDGSGVPTSPSLTGNIYVGVDRTGGGGNLQGFWYRFDPISVP